MGRAGCIRVRVGSGRGDGKIVFIYLAEYPSMIMFFSFFVFLFFCLLSSNGSLPCPTGVFYRDDKPK